MRRTWGALLALGLLLARPDRARADEADPHAVTPERPSVATDVHTVAAGWTEIEFGVEDDWFAADEHTLISTGLGKLGLTPRVELDLTPTRQRSWSEGVSQAGFGDLTAGLKWRALDHSRTLGSFAVLPSVKFPTGSVDKGTGTGTTDVSMLLISSSTFRTVSSDANLGYTHRFGPLVNTTRNSTLWAASSGLPLWGATVCLEMFGYPGTGGVNGASPSVAVLYGVQLTPRPWLETDVAFITPVEGRQPHAVLAGFVWNVGQLWKTR